MTYKPHSDLGLYFVATCSRDTTDESREIIPTRHASFHCDRTPRGRPGGCLRVLLYSPALLRVVAQGPIESIPETLTRLRAQRLSGLKPSAIIATSLPETTCVSWGRSKSENCMHLLRRPVERHVQSRRSWSCQTGIK